MSLPDRRRSEWAPWKPAAVLQDVSAHGMLLALGWFGGLGYLGLVLLLAAEPVFIILLTFGLYPQRGLARHLGDLLKSSALLVFLFAFVLLTYGLASQQEDFNPIETLSRLRPSLLAWSLAFTGLHLGSILLYARSTPDPRKTWARLALNQGAVTFISIFMLIFVAAFFGSFAVEIAAKLAPQVAPDNVLVLLAVLVRFGFALLMSRIPERELDQIARNPYVD